jgi:DNA-binding NtrC family response regulator
MPELSLANIRSRSYHSSSFEFSADETEAVRRLVGHTAAEVECELIVETLSDQGGSRTNSAKLLGISLRTLRNKIQEYNGRGKIVPKPRIIALRSRRAITQRHIALTPHASGLAMIRR